MNRTSIRWGPHRDLERGTWDQGPDTRWATDAFILRGRRTELAYYSKCGRTIHLYSNMKLSVSR